MRIQAPLRPSEGHCPSRRPVAPNYTILCVIFGYFTKLKWLLRRLPAPKSVKMFPNGPQMVQNSPKWAANGPKMPQIAPKLVHKGPKWSEIAQKPSKIDPKWPHSGPKSVKIGPKGCKMSYNRSTLVHNSSRWFNMVENRSTSVKVGQNRHQQWSQVAQIGPKYVQNRPKSVQNWSKTTRFPKALQ
jgi:hypothetical protein